MEISSIPYRNKSRIDDIPKYHQYHIEIKLVLMTYSSSSIQLKYKSRINDNSNVINDTIQSHSFKVTAKETVRQCSMPSK